MAVLYIEKVINKISWKSEWCRDGSSKQSSQTSIDIHYSTLRSVVTHNHPYISSCSITCVLCLPLPSLHLSEIFLLLVCVLFYECKLAVYCKNYCLMVYVYSLPHNKMASNGEPLECQETLRSTFCFVKTANSRCSTPEEFLPYHSCCHHNHSL